MYNPSFPTSSRELLTSQQWSQLDSQDWNSQDFNLRMPATPARSRVLPPTPSSGSQGTSNNLSNSWSGRSNSQMTPQSHSQTFTSVRDPPKEVFFSREIRFALHAVLMVIKELPDKLKDVISKSLETKNTLDESTLQNIEKMVVGKMTDFSKLFSSDLKEVFVDDNKKFQDMVQNGIEELNKNMVTRDCEVVNLRENINNNTENIKKQIHMVRKLYLSESKKLQTLLMDLKNDGNKSEMETRIQSTLAELQTLTQASKDCNEELFQLFQEKENDEIWSQSKVINEITTMRTCLQSLPTMITSSLKECLREIGTPSSFKQNVRVASGSSRPSFLKPSCSPVARVIPQMKRSGMENSNLNNSYEGETDFKEKKPKCVLDIIDYKTNMKNLSPCSVQIIKEEKDVTTPHSWTSNRKIPTVTLESPSFYYCSSSKRVRITPLCSVDEGEPFSLLEPLVSEGLLGGEVTFSKPVSRHRPFN